MLAHFKFFKGLHQWVKHIALATNSVLVDLVVSLAQHFVSAKIFQFGFDEVDDDIGWTLNDTDYVKVWSVDWYMIIKC